MATYTLWTDELIEASNYTIVSGEEVVLLSSTPVPNGGGSAQNSLSVTIDYSDLVNDFGSGRIGAMIEAKDSAGNWHPIHYQFNSIYSLVQQAPQRTLILQPDMDTFNLGIDDVVYPVNKEIARISRGQGSLPTTEWRVCILLTDFDPAGANPFVSLRVSGTAETYNV